MTKHRKFVSKNLGMINRAVRQLKVALVWGLILTLVGNSAVVQATGVSSRNRRSSKPAVKPALRTVVQGQTMVVWGPQQVVRQPVNTTYYASFALPSGAIAPYQMTVSNGAPNGTQKVTQACIKLNGVNVLSPTCFHSVNPTPQVRTVSLQANNNIEVSLVGPVLSYITITVTANQASLAVSPVSGNQGQTMVVNLTGTGTNWVSGQTTASFGGEINTDWVNVTSATAATAQITISATAALGPRNVTVTTGSEIVTATDSFTVNAVTPPGAASSTVSTLAGSAGNPGLADGSGATARFRQLAGLAAAPNEVVYVADAGNHAIRRVDANGAVTTTAGNGSPGMVDAQGASAQFNNPQGVAFDSITNSIFVADAGNHSIRRIDSSGNVTTFAGDGTAGFTNGQGAAARFNNPKGVAVDNLGRVLVADTGNHVVRRIDGSGNVTTLAGDGTSGTTDGTAARFNGLAGVAVDGQTAYVYLADTGNHRIRRLDNNPITITLAGQERGFKDGLASQSRFADPTGIAIDGAGHIIVTETTNSLVREVDPVLALNNQPNAVFTLAGTGGRGSTDGAGNVAKFNKPAGVAVLASSAVIVADTGNNTLRKILLPPVIASLSPSQGAIGATVTIAGNRFDARGTSFNTVKFAATGGGTVNATVTSATRSELVVTVPTGTVTGNVTVQTAAGTSNGVAFTLGGGQPPAIADFNPKTGPIGTLVTITGSNLMVGSTTPTVTFAGPNSSRLNAPAAFASLTEVRATVPANAVTGVIQLITTAGTATSALPFTIAPSQDFALTLAPSSQTVVQGSTATFEVMATSPQTNFSQLISLTAPGLTSNAVATFNPSQITAGGKSTLTIKLSPAISPTSYNFTVQGIAKVDGSDLTKTTSGSFTVMASGSTTLAGRVLSTDAVAIPGCTVSASAPGGSNVTATTDAAGNFLLIGLQAGSARPIFIQPPSGSVYPAIKEPADVSANQSNVVPYTFYLPAIDPLNTPINPNGPTDVFSTRPGLGELKMTIPQGISLRILDANNNPTGTVTHVSITPVPIDRTPAPLPNGVRASLVYTSQPGNSCVWNTATNSCFIDDTGPKIPVTYPNLSGANPGAQVPLWAFNHNTVNWYQYGLGTVSADGKRITPNAGAGLRDFSWHFASTPTGNGGNPGDPNSCPSNRGNEPVDYSTGFKIETMTDISIGGARGGLELTRTYTSHQAIFYTGNGFADSNVFRFGVGTRDNYDVRLIGTFTVNGSGYLVLPEQTPFSLFGTQTFNGGRLFSYDATLSASGVTTFTNSTTGSMLGDTIRRIDAQTLEYRSTRGFILRFEPNFNPDNLVVENYYRLKSITDRNNNTTTLTYAGSNLAQVTDPVGRTLTFTYASPNCTKCVSQVVAGKAGDPLQRIASYTYDGTRHLIKVTDQLGKDYEYVYSGNNLSQVKDRRGNTVKTLAYDANGRVITQTFADGGTIRYNYTLSGDVVTGITIIDQLGRTMSKRFNAQGYVIEEIDALGQVSKIERAIGTNTLSKSTGPCGCSETEKTYDNRGNVLTVKDRLNQTESWQYRQFSPASSYDPVLNQVTIYTDKRNKVTSYGYDAVSPNTLTPKGNLTSVTNALNQTTNYAYDSLGRLTTITDALNHATTMGYDANSYVSSQTDALNHATTFQYDLVGNLKNVFDPLGRETRMVYDNLDRLTEVRNPANLTGNPSYTYGYDDNSNRTSVTDANLKTWTFTYDKKNRQETVTEPTLPASRTTRWQYDVADQLLQVIAPSGRTLRYTYDARGQQQTITDSLGNTISFGYDNRSNAATLSDQRGNITAFTYDELFRLTGQRDSLGRLITLEYDSVGNVIAQTDRLGRRTTISYDNINRPITVNYADATANYGYDSAGRLMSASDASGAITWQYDNANRVTAEVTNLGTVSYGYNNANQRTTMTAADRPPVTYGYDSAGRLQTISQTTGGVTELFTYGYDALSRRTQLQRQANGAGIVTTDYEYDEISRLKRLKHTRVSTGTLHEDFQYEYNLDDEITKISSLASAPLTPQSKTATMADAANRIGQFGAASYSFNQEGQTTSKTDASGTTNYQWDVRGRLKQVTLPNGAVVNYGYDVFNRRISRSANSVTTTFQHDVDDVVIDRGSDGSSIDYLNGPDVDDKLRQASGIYGTLYFLADRLGSVAVLANASGILNEQFQYEAFGSNPGSIRTRYTYTGRERDDVSGLVFYRARWYDTQQGRFISEDPIGFWGGWNFYAYVGNNPLSRKDPTGLLNPGFCALGGFAGGALLGAGIGGFIGGGVGALGFAGGPLGVYTTVTFAVGGAKIGAVIGGFGGGIAAGLYCRSKSKEKCEPKAEPKAVPRPREEEGEGKWTCLVRCNVNKFANADPDCPDTVEGIGRGNTRAEAEYNGELAAKATLRSIAAGRKLGCTTRHCHPIWCVKR